VDLRDYLVTVASSYDRSAGLGTDTQKLLRSAQIELAGLTPAGYIVIGSGGKGHATFTPWFGFFDPDETTSPEQGIYVCYLFTGDMTRIMLTLLQGITELDRTVGRRRAREQLQQDADRIRASLPPEVMGQLSAPLDLGSMGFRQRAYEASCIASLQYVVASIPDEDALRSDLGRFLDLYQLAIDAKRKLLQQSPGSIHTSSSIQTTPGSDPLRFFKPRNDSDYVATLAGRTLIKSRRHERLLHEYGVWLTARGFSVANNTHPRDMTATRSGTEWLIEAKVVYMGNATEAVRSALGQLYPIATFSTRSTVHLALWPCSPSRSVGRLSHSSNRLESLQCGVIRVAG
jgi:hypothetical protein